METKIIKLENCESPAYPVGKIVEKSLSFANVLADKIGKTIKKQKVPVILWGRGSSGAILCAFVCVRLKELGFKEVNINHIKKPGEISHCDTGYVINCLGKTSPRHIIVDDIMASGTTIKEIYKVVQKFCEHPMLAICDCYMEGLTFEPQIIFLKNR